MIRLTDGLMILRRFKDESSILEIFRRSFILPFPLQYYLFSFSHSLSPHLFIYRVSQKKDARFSKLTNIPHLLSDNSVREINIKHQLKIIYQSGVLYWKPCINLSLHSSFSLSLLLSPRSIYLHMKVH